MAADNPEAVFTPDWAGGNSAFDTVSWAIYQFDLTGQIGRVVVSTHWAEPPQDFTNLWIGLSNWARDRWDWHSGAPEGQAQPGTGALEHYSQEQSGIMYVAVVLLGQQQATLRNVEVNCFSMRGDWWMAGRDATRAANSPFVGPGYPKLSWQAQLSSNGFNAAEPAYDALGNCYIPSPSGTGPTTNFYALRPDGTQLWMASLASMGSGVFSPALADDGTVYCTLNQGELFALGVDGAQLWSFTGHGGMASAPILGPGGEVYLLGGEGPFPTRRYFYALTAQGALQWEHDFGNELATEPAVAADGTIYTGSTNGKLYAMRQNGSTKWTFTSSAAIQSNPVIGDGGIVFFTNNEQMLHAVNPDGTPAWSVPIGRRGDVTPGPAGRVYIRSGAFVDAYDAGGVLAWSYDAGGYGNISVDGAGTVYTTSTNSRVYAIKPDGTLMWWFTTSAPLQGTPVLAEDGTLYVMDYLGTLYALGPGGQTLEYAASGYVMDEHGSGLAGVEISITGEEPVITDASGYWSADGLTTGAYLISPSLPGYTFEPLFTAVQIKGGDAGIPQFTGEPLAAPVWPMWGGNSAHTRRSPASGPTVPVLRWSYHASGEDLRMEPVIGGDGTLYIQGKKYGLYAVNPDGSPHWQAFSDYPNLAPPVISVDGKCYTTTAGNTPQIRAYTAAGALDWTRNYDGINSVNTLAVATDGTLRLGLYDSIASFTSNGELQWSFEPVTATRPAISQDGVCFVGGSIYGSAEYHDKVIALNPDGTLKWASAQYHGWLAVPSAAATDDLGTVYTSNDIQFIALNSSDGSEKWIYDFADSTTYSSASLPAIAMDGNVLFTVGKADLPETNKLIALYPDGTLKWEYSAGGAGFVGPPTVDAIGVAYVSMKGVGDVRAIRPDGTLRWNFDAPQAETGTISIGADGTLYFGDKEGYLYALGPGGG